MNKTTQVNKITPATPADPPPPKAAFKNIFGALVVVPDSQKIKEKRKTK